MADPSFDIVSEVNWMEVQNAVQQAVKEITTRFDFKGTAAAIEHPSQETIVLTADSEAQVRQVKDVLHSKLVKRGVSLKSIEEGAFEPAAKATVRQTLTLKSGLESDQAKEVAKFIRGLGLKVQPTIQGDQVRVTGKKKDDLQAVISLLKSKDFDFALQFTNYR